MQNYKKFQINRNDIIPTAQAMKALQRQLVMIHGYVDKEGQNVVSYDYEVENCLESYFIRGEQELPSLGAIYDTAATWPERELHELMGLSFSGLDTSERLFLADNMLSGQGHIIVTPLSELREQNIGEQKGAEDATQKGGLA